MELTIIFSILSLIIIFIYGTENFSKEIQNSMGEQFQSILNKATKNKITATIFGALITAITNSSAATTIIAIGLVNAGTITFAQSLGVIFGANIGTTITAQLIALKFTQYAPIIIVFGFVLSLLKTKYKIFGKPLFYLGLILFSMTLISELLIPLRNDPFLLNLLAQTTFLPIGILIGFIITNIFFSSTVTTGLIVVLAQNGFIGLPQAIPIIFGANLGTTTIGILFSYKKDVFAKRAALAHFLFNLIGVLIFIPIIGYLIIITEYFGGTPAQQVANLHLIFNLGATIILLIFIKYFQTIVEIIIPTKEQEISTNSKLLDGAENKKSIEAFNLIEKEFKNSLEFILKGFFENKKNIFSRTIENGKIIKINALTKNIHKKTKFVLTQFSKKQLTKKENYRIVKLARISKLIQKLGQNILDFEQILIESKNNGSDFSDDSKINLDESITKLSDNLILLKDNLHNFDKKIVKKMQKNEDELRSIITKNYKNYFERLVKGQITSGSLFVDALEILQDSESKIREIRKILS